MERDFKGIWIPKEIWFDDRLGVLDKIILMEIDSLDCDDEGCYASNEYLSKFCQCTETKISTSISKLIELGYIEIIKFDGRRRYIKSRLKLFERQTLKNLKADFKKFKDINIDYNNKENNNINIIIKEKFKKPSIEEIVDYCKERNNGIDGERFYNFYESKGWMVGKNKMKDWKACIRTWERTNKSNTGDNLPKWYGKEIKEKELSEEDERELQELIRGY